MGQFFDTAGAPFSSAYAYLYTALYMLVISNVFIFLIESGYQQEVNRLEKLEEEKEKKKKWVKNLFFKKRIFQFLRKFRFFEFLRSFKFCLWLKFFREEAEEGANPNDALKALMQGVTEKKHEEISRKCLGNRDTFSAANKKKQFEFIMSKLIDIKDDLKGAMNQKYSSQIGEILSRIEIMGEMLDEYDHTLADLELEIKGNKNCQKIKNFFFLRKFEES